jgi:hypothetical protein
VTVRRVREALLPRLAARTAAAPRPAAQPQAAGAEGLLAVTGIAHVLAVLEAIEDGRLTDASVVEPFVCDGGCFGSPLLAEDACVSSWRWSAETHAAQVPQTTHPRAHPYRPRPGIRLDADMAIAIRKLAELDSETRTLPGKDCGVCGAPTCAALAEDIVMGRAQRALCPYVAPEEENGI